MYRHRHHRRPKEKGATGDETVGWHHQFNGRELGQNLGDSEEQGGLACAVHGVTKIKHNLATEQMLC